MTTYDPSLYPPVGVTVDLVVLTVHDDQLMVLVVERANDPFKGGWALPGGFIEPNETLEESARRELAEETGMELEGVVLEQLASYGDPRRDPRMRIVSVAHLALIPYPGEPEAGSDAKAAMWLPVEGSVKDSLAFDHGDILKDGLTRARSKLEYTTHALSFLPDEFTMSDLRRVYEIVWGRRLDPGNFHRKVASIEGFVKATRQTTKTGGKPAVLYRTGSTMREFPTPIFRKDQA